MASRAPSIAATETARRVASGDMLHDAAFGFCHLSRVKVKGLAKKKDLNGVHGTISCAGTGQAMPGPHRWNVELDAPHSKIVRIKGQNLAPSSRRTFALCASRIQKLHTTWPPVAIPRYVECAGPKSAEPVILNA